MRVRVRVVVQVVVRGEHTAAETAAVVVTVAVVHVVAGDQVLQTESGVRQGFQALHHVAVDRESLAHDSTGKDQRRDLPTNTHVITLYHLHQPICVFYS